jgi:vancomycin resistance protein YoaR
MVPLARQNHNEFINRYPPGLDATVWIVGKTKQTMSFKNDTEYPILITRTITNDGSRRWLTFKIWSVPNGRTPRSPTRSSSRAERASHGP